MLSKQLAQYKLAALHSQPGLLTTACVLAFRLPGLLHLVNHNDCCLHCYIPCRPDCVLQRELLEFSKHLPTCEKTALTNQEAHLHVDAC
jgi:hypothetical protein